ncbi:hypothetical protein DL770_000963 [Monosporascus sp. CRB-9-2]|nr:hypothetical protein DL770_000963 [Monosporascus sp. CRB-9-2]
MSALHPLAVAAAACMRDTSDASIPSESPTRADLRWPCPNLPSRRATKPRSSGGATFTPPCVRFTSMGSVESREGAFLQEPQSQGVEHLRDIQPQPTAVRLRRRQKKRRTPAETDPV